ncbi:MAG: hypothetical protein CMJ18_21875 [Phycisphaeraceae bacterium]|nr:hypothetical protein [Phycisphaeraceae bacterium]
MGNELPRVLPRMVPEGRVPLAAFEGTAYECGEQFAQFTLENYPGYRRRLDEVCMWESRMTPTARKLIEKHAPHVPDVIRGLVDTCGPPEKPAPGGGTWGCTSFGLSGKVTLDGHPISGGTRDVHREKAFQHIVLRMRIKDAPTILVHTYPGDILGLMGFWSTGMSIFSNALYSREESKTGLTSAQWAFVALAGSSAEAAAELAEEHGLQASGNCLVSDPEGCSMSVEFNGGGVSIVPAKGGIATHANHPEGPKTAPFEAVEFLELMRADDLEDSRIRMHGLWSRFYTERGRLSAPKVMQLLADHTHFPTGVCSHMHGGNTEYGTTAAIVAEPTRGLIHVTRGNPCCNWPTTYEM